ncbi:Yet2p [Saccharomyces cerevisiae YJM1419]|uniref:Endoplasmic reticulum transmembrane protein n=2 Tax=Saccharomyces cerevisiae TaxID=4932 RepID=G2WK93_YEASK|nr:Yet2p [Saccharomyces cerevisiae YJM320]AJS68030.1 Yet2p [Saccharomyces cerevisiae YJM470]AJS68905.1 Yet2p [Saccharomyces cerevisiae YJM554]AJS69342.1 Yet2p [Saccharomyces cerevisiae YJM555]AJS78526.1 Yet2p [Saccharomyces cerevisiae YJM1202]AJS88972.1 Yet2p [Saccharomyces cerevisiae YJM1388]AJS89410.1 Yet2p [Saccharomyces cerevisiae YJM1389]AJS90718.1 Yet2p [Saccharomyces cerevisiae YJM1401]AJS92909.1 Yet2p [Saccharomyces cerevisiae YJM1419]AJS96373.1 Yet2p [Saccharomyces cerevisiae YJM1
MGVYLAVLFSLLVIEMAILFILVLPLPQRMRRWLYIRYSIISTNKKFRTYMVGIMIFVGLLFIDSWKRSQIKVSTYRNQKNPYIINSVTPVDALASRAYNQRNVYISGFIIYFYICILTVMSILRRIVEWNDKMKAGDDILKEKLRQKQKYLEELQKKKF